MTSSALFWETYDTPNTGAATAMSNNKGKTAFNHYTSALSALIDLHGRVKRLSLTHGEYVQKRAEWMNSEHFKRTSAHFRAVLNGYNEALVSERERRDLVWCHKNDAGCWVRMSEWKPEMLQGGYERLSGDDSLSTHCWEHSMQPFNAKALKNG